MVWSMYVNGEQKSHLGVKTAVKVKRKIKNVKECVFIKLINKLLLIKNVKKNVINIQLCAVLLTYCRAVLGLCAITKQYRSSRRAKTITQDSVQSHCEEFRLLYKKCQNYHMALLQNGPIVPANLNEYRVPHLKFSLRVLETQSWIGIENPFV